MGPMSPLFFLSFINLLHPTFAKAATSSSMHLPRLLWSRSVALFLLDVMGGEDGINRFFGRDVEEVDVWIMGRDGVKAIEEACKGR